MAFSDNWAVQNAENQLREAIANEETVINGAYVAIGKAYAIKYAGDPSCEFAAQVAAAKEAENKVDIYRAQIRELKGLVVCEKCGADVANTSAFCTTCGAEMPIPADRIKCNGCGCLVAKDVQFCTCCGKLMIVAQTSGAAPAPAAPAAPAAAKTCQNCGAAVEDGLAFCTECGTRLDAPTAPVEPVAPAVPAAPVAPAPTPAPAQPQGNVCPACGAVVEDGMAFCTECGSSMKAAPAPAAKTCPNCGEVVEDGMRFCEQCGTKL